MIKRFQINQKLVGLLLSICCISSASAVDVSDGYQAYPLELTNKLEILRVDVTSSGIIQFISKGGKWGKSCPDADHAQVLPSHKMQREIYAQGLVAQTNGSRVMFYARCTSHSRIIHIENMYKD